MAGSSCSSSSSGHGGLRGLFSRRRRRRGRRASNGALPGAGDALWAEQQAREARRELVDSLSTPELFALRELVHVAIHKAPVVPPSPSEASSLSAADPMRLGASSASSTPPSSTTTSTSTTPPSSTSAGSPRRRQQRQDRVDAALTRSKRFYFPRSANERLRLRGRSQFVRLFPLLSRTSRTAQRALFRAFDRDGSGKIEFDELCEILAQCRLARQASTLDAQAALIFAWFQDRPRADSLSSSAVRLLATTARELGGKEQQESESNGGYSLVAALDELLLQGQHEVSRPEFVQRMNCDLGAHVLHVLLAPFDVVRALLDEESILLEARATQWKAGDTAYVVAAAWWTRWLQYVAPPNRTGSIRLTTAGNHSQDGTVEAQGAVGVQDTQPNRRRDGQRIVQGATARPGAIANHTICEDEQVATLRPGLVRGEDYVLVSERVWSHLLQIYDGGPELPRQITTVLPLEAQIDEEDVVLDASKPETTTAPSCTVSYQQQRVEVELYPVSLQIRLARHDSRHVYLVFARRFLLAQNTSLKEIVHRLGVFPGLNAREVTLWVRRQRLKSWTRLDCNLEGPRATLDGLQITSTQELLVDFRALDIDDDPRSVAQQRRRSSLAACLPRVPFAVDLLQPAGNDFVRCSSHKMNQFAKTGNWKLLGESTVVAEAHGGSVSHHAHRLTTAGGSGGVLTGLAKHLEMATKDGGHSRRLVSSVGLRATGLVNMGNTCFMNSALQCFSHSPLLREYFLALRYERSVNKKNRLGSRGAVASAYAQLETALWREREHGYLLPGPFRDEFTHVRRHFQETRQHDSHEFMVALLDCLHEDLNQGGKQMAKAFSSSDDTQERSSKCLGYLDFVSRSGGGEDAEEEVPAAPLSDELQGEAAWRAHTNMNSSVVVDLFHGQMRSETVCGTCGERKCAFDPNLFFSLPIPESKYLRVEVSIVLQARALPGEDKEADSAMRTVRRGFWLQRGSNVGSLCDRIASTQGCAGGNRFLFVEVRRSRIKRVVEGDEVVDRLGTAGTSALYAFERAWTLSEIPVVPTSLAQLCDEDGRRERRSSGGGKIDLDAATHEKISSFADLRVGSRVDARDNHNDWHTGTVIEVNGDAEDSQQQQANGQSSLSSSGRKRTPRVCVHFDAFSGRWNKWFTARDWLAQRLLPLHTRTSNATEVFEVQVVHRFATRASSSTSAPSESKTHGLLSEGRPLLARRTSASTRERVALDVFGTPLFVTVASDKTARDMHRSVLLQAARFWKGFEAFKNQKAVRDDQTKASSLSGVTETHASVTGSEHARRSSTDCKYDDGKTGLPYSVRVVNLEDLGSSRGEPLPFDSSALLQHFSTRSVLALDWRDYREYARDETRAEDDVPDDVVKAAETDSVLRADLDAAAELVRKQHASEEEDSPASSAETPPMHAVPLSKCMDALMRDEAISLEDHWVCERCGVAREGTRRSAIWRLPDLVMVQLKRFQYLENQHKQKVRALVDFPLKGLDFSRWMGHHDASGGEDASVYDLYAVANHVGGLTRGHYTAYCRYDADFPESAALFSSTAGNAENHSEVQCSELWFRFDDEKVSEIAAGDVVTDAAYVLFYKRRTLSPHNVLRYVL